jgi:hypothetical protein
LRRHPDGMIDIPDIALGDVANLLLGSWIAVGERLAALRTYEGAADKHLAGELVSELLRLKNRRKDC